METIDKNSSIRSAASAVLVSRCRTVFVTDEDSTLLGSVTEGDLVRAFLNGINLEASVRHVMNSNPFFVVGEISEDYAMFLMSRYGHSAIPVVDDDRRVVRVLKQTGRYV